MSKERPILFSAPMVRALLAGTKTQTRRVVKARKDRDMGCEMAPCELAGEVNAGEYLNAYCAPGDRLWVRESWMPDPPIDDTWASTQWAGCREGKISGVPERFRYPRFCNYAAHWLHGKVIWTPSIHMPRWASRITLEVSGVRVERLQDISAHDARAEGISEFIGGWWCEHDDAEQIAGMTPQEGYRSLWERINGPGSWDTNPWVWVIEFPPVTSPAKEPS